jgi:hypothetical protein
VLLSCQQACAAGIHSPTHRRLRALPLRTGGWLLRQRSAPAVPRSCSRRQEGQGWMWARLARGFTALSANKRIPAYSGSEPSARESACCELHQPFTCQPPWLAALSTPELGLPGACCRLRPATSTETPAPHLSQPMLRSAVPTRSMSSCRSSSLPSAGAAWGAETAARLNPPLKAHRHVSSLAAKRRISANHASSVEICAHTTGSRCW